MNIFIFKYILFVLYEKKNSTHLSLINRYLLNKYKITEEILSKILCETQIKSLMV